MCLCVSCFVGLSAFYWPHDICPLCGAASECPRAAKPSRAARRTSGQAHAQRESTRAHAVQLLNEKIAALMPFKNKTVRACACCRVRNCRDFQKKGKKKTNMPLPKFSLQFAFSWSVYFSNRTESYLIFGRSRPWSARILYIYIYIYRKVDNGNHAQEDRTTRMVHCTFIIDNHTLSTVSLLP